MATKRKKPEQSPPPCHYGCGRPSVGTLIVAFTEYGSDDPDNWRARREGFSTHLAACRECLRAAVRVDVTLPKTA